VIHGAAALGAEQKRLLNYNAEDEMHGVVSSTVDPWASLSPLGFSESGGEPNAKSGWERDEVIAWLVAAAHKAVSETRGRTQARDATVIFFWRGLAATAAGVIAR